MKTVGLKLLFAITRVTIANEPAVDTGGVRRQFFSVVFRQLAYPSLCASYSVFEGSSFRLRPAYKASNVSSGMLKIVGMMIAHSLLLDGQGFPYLSDYCYYYLANCPDLAITSISIDDVGMKVKSILHEVSYTLYHYSEGQP